MCSVQPPRRRSKGAMSSTIQNFALIGFLGDASQVKYTLPRFTERAARVKGSVCSFSSNKTSLLSALLTVSAVFSQRNVDATLLKALSLLK